jgi:hypothetical protein
MEQLDVDDEDDKNVEIYDADERLKLLYDDDTAGYVENGISCCDVI